MSDHISQLFDVPAHNPSWFAVTASDAWPGEVLDFCIPVNLHFPPAALSAAIRRDLPEILRYYPDYADVHQRHLAELAGVPAEAIVPCNGSTEIITVLCQAADAPLLTPVPTFSRWTDLPLELGVALHTIECRRQRLFRLTVGDLVDRARAVAARTVVVSNPNNPTGMSFSRAEIVELGEALRDTATLIVDESFIDFSGTASAADYAVASPHVTVIKSLGKSLGWHGVRLGYAVASPPRAAALRRRLPFWNVNGLAAYVLRSLRDYAGEYRASFARVKQDRIHLAERLWTVPGITVFPSDANFLYVELPEGVSGRVLRDRMLRRHGVMVRECSNKLGSSEQYLRLAVQAPDRADVLVAALRAELAVTTGRPSR